MLDELRELGSDVYAALDERVVDLTGLSMHELPADRLRAVLHRLHRELSDALSSSLVPAADLVASGVELPL